jgi:hypothetical protein
LLHHRSCSCCHHLLQERIICLLHHSHLLHHCHVLLLRVHLAKAIRLQHCHHWVLHCCHLRIHHHHWVHHHSLLNLLWVHLHLSGLHRSGLSFVFGFC